MSEDTTQLQEIARLLDAAGIPHVIETPTGDQPLTAPARVELLITTTTAALETARDAVHALERAYAQLQNEAAMLRACRTCNRANCATCENQQELDALDA